MITARYFPHNTFAFLCNESSFGQKFKILFICFCIATIINTQAQSYQADDGYVEFISTAPLLEFKGVSNHLNGLVDLDRNLLDFYVDLNTLETGIRRRDRDMRSSYLNTDQFPFAEFTGEIVTGFDSALEREQPVRAKGTFTIHGVEREMEVEGTLQSSNNTLILKAGWVVRLEDHNIDRPRVLFYELAEEQRVNIHIILTKTTD